MELQTEQLKRLTLDEMNSGLRHYREDLRYTRADAINFATLWNTHAVSTAATVISDNGVPCVVVVDYPFNIN